MSYTWGQVCFLHSSLHFNFIDKYTFCFSKVKSLHYYTFLISFGSCKFSFIKRSDGASLVAQWLRICLPMQGTRVRALVWEDPTCHGATGPVSHNC